MEDTITKTKSENDILIEQMLRDAQRAPEPGGGEDKIVSKGDEDTPLMVITELKSANYVYIYETKTGEASVANRNMLPMLLTIKNPNGANRFTTIRPSVTPVRGTLICLLHLDNPSRKHYTELGLPVCRKSNLTSPYMVMQHVKKRHPSAWATIELERTEKERQEDRALQRLMIQSATKETDEAPLYISDKDKGKK